MDIEDCGAKKQKSVDMLDLSGESDPAVCCVDRPSRYVSETAIRISFRVC